MSFKITTSIQTYSIPTSRYDFTKADWSAINNHLFCIDCQTAFAECLDVPAQFDLWNDKLTEIIRPFIPVKMYYSNSGVGPNKYPLHSRKLLSKKRSAWRIYKLSKSTAVHVRYKTIAAGYRKALYTLKCNRELALVNSVNTGAFYRYANSKLKSKVSVAPLITPSGDVTSYPIVKADLLNEYFSSIFQTDNNIIPPSPQQLPILSINPVFTIVKVKIRMHKLDPKSVGGLDGVPPIFLKICQHSLSPPLAHLFSLSCTHSYLPPSWKLAYITPIFKKGDPACVSNYRPVSLASTTCKLMEYIFKYILCSS